MPRHATYTIIVDESDAQALLDALNAPRQPDDEATDPGLGLNTAPSIPDDLTPLARTNANPNAPTAEKRQITLSVAPGDEADRLQAIVDGIASAEMRQWHPSGCPVDPQTRELDHDAECCETPADHRAAVDVGVLTPDDSQV